MKHLESAGHRGHGTERTLETARGTGACSGTHDLRVRQLSDGAMTGGNQPTNIRGINRRRKVPGGPLTPAASSHQRDGPFAGAPTSFDRSIHISRAHYLMHTGRKAEAGDELTRALESHRSAPRYARRGQLGTVIQAKRMLKACRVGTTG